MILPRFDVLVPETVEEACSLLSKYQNEGVRLLAGGTDLLVDLRQTIITQHIPRCDGCPTHPNGRILSTIDCSLWSSEPVMDSAGSLRDVLAKSNMIPPRFLVSLHKLDKLKGIKKLENGQLNIGALTTITQIEQNEFIRRDWTALAEGADSLGSPLVRNRGTIGGNIANARPAADTVIPTIALGGKLTLTGMSGIRTVAAEGFPQGPGITIINPDEMLTAVEYPASPPHSGSAYYKLANRKALEISTVGVAVWLSLEEPGGSVKDVRIALGAVGPTPILAESAKDILIAKKPDRDIIRVAAKSVAGDARPIDDHRGSAAYRLKMIEILTERLINIAYKRASGDR
jgi:carbon-monoxide dehydrogenase medium subunit